MFQLESHQLNKQIQAKKINSPAQSGGRATEGGEGEKKDKKGEEGGEGETRGGDSSAGGGGGGGLRGSGRIPAREALGGA